MVRLLTEMVHLLAEMVKLLAEMVIFWPKRYIPFRLKMVISAKKNRAEMTIYRRLPPLYICYSHVDYKWDLYRSNDPSVY